MSRDQDISSQTVRWKDCRLSLSRFFDIITVQWILTVKYCGPIFTPAKLYKLACICWSLFWSFSFWVSANFTTRGDEHPWEHKSSCSNNGKDWSSILTSVKHAMTVCNYDDCDHFQANSMGINSQMHCICSGCDEGCMCAVVDRQKSKAIMTKAIDTALM